VRRTTLVRVPAPTARIEEKAPTLTIGQAREHYRAALDGLRAGDWAAFAREMEALGKALERSSTSAAPEGGSEATP
jgi:hypothetical protein